MESIILLGSFLLLFLLNVPISFAIGMSSVLTVIYNGKFPLSIITQSMGTGVDSFPLMAIPFFMLAGIIMSEGGIGLRLINFASSLVGFVKGGLAMVTVVTNMIMAGMSGSSVADSSATGSVLIPAMQKKGYTLPFTVSLVACASVIGIIIPPSIPFVIYGVISGTSIGQLFLGGAIPGILVGLSLMAISYYYARKENFPREEWGGLKKIWQEFKSSFFALMMPVIILGGILGGIMTPTESAAVAVVYAVIVGKFVYKELTLDKIPKILVESLVGTASVMFLVAVASGFGWLLASEQIPQMIAQTILSISTNKFIVLLIVNILLLITGTFMDLTAALIILGPVLIPLVQKVGVDPLHFGVIMTMNLGIGLVTPPVGVCLFVCCNIAKTTITKVAKALVPMIIAMVIVLFLVTYIPPLATYLPKMLVK